MKHRVGRAAPFLRTVEPARHLRLPTARLLLFAALLLPGCSKDKAGPAPVPTHALTGRVRLVGQLVDLIGASHGDRVVNDADGIRVYLVSGGVVVDSTLTQDGGFGFRVVLGTYFAFVRVGDGFADSTEELHVHDTDRFFPDTIAFGAVPYLRVYPNPFATSVTLIYALVTSGDMRLEVRTLGGTLVKSVVAENRPPGIYSVAWDGLDNAGHSAPIGTYWVVLEKSDLHQAALVFRDGYTLSGRVRMASSLWDAVGTSLGNVVITDAEGVRVRLGKPDGSSDSTLTHAGRYAFGVTQSGTYSATTWVVPSEPVSIPDIVVAGADVSARDTLKLEPAGELKTYPNPFSYPEGVGAEFHMDQALNFDIAITTLDGTPVWTYSGLGTTGLNHIHWIGVDNQNHPVDNGSYWISVKTGAQQRYGLVFKQ